jgi:RNA recognition motif-containing protein
VVKVIRNPETQESKGFAFIEAPNQEEMNSIIRRFDRAPLEDRLLRANPAQPPKSRSAGGPNQSPSSTERPKRQFTSSGSHGGNGGSTANGGSTVNRDRKPSSRRNGATHSGSSAFAEELAKVL